MAEILHCALDLNFPEGVARCGTCEVFEKEPRWQCRRTGEYVTELKTYGYWCPLWIVDENTGQIRRLGNGWNE